MGTADPRTELDSHANMIVVGSECFVFESTGRSCTVHPFSTDLGSAKDVPIVDAALAYDCQYTGQTIILIARNALHIRTMKNNLIPPFIMRAGGVIVNDKPKIHCDNPTVQDHSLSFHDSDVRIPLQLHGIFSYFHTRSPNEKELYECEKVFISPDFNDWNPHCTSYERNERSMLDFEGNMSEMSRRTSHQTVFDENNSEDHISISMASVKISDWDNSTDKSISSAFVSPPFDTNEVTNHDSSFCNALNIRTEISKLSASIGSCNISNDTPEFDEDNPKDSTLDDIEPLLKSYLSEDSIKVIKAKIAAVQASRPKGVSKEHLSKIWLISEELAQGAIEKNTQLVRHSKENTLS